MALGTAGHATRTTYTIFSMHDGASLQLSAIKTGEWQCQLVTIQSLVGLPWLIPNEPRADTPRQE